ncbi:MULTISPECIES: hypothetical protein [Streptomyces]|uniref:Secreted protein n=1 Tax=Streptomyces galilaeus TaxID=33899 RepID=A0ABW9IW59_STRGJ
MPGHRIGTILAVIGGFLTLAGVTLYVLPGPGLPLLVLGLITLTVGLATLTETRRNKTSGPHHDRNRELT